MRRLYDTQFLVTIPSIAVMKLLQKMGPIRFTCYDLVGTVEETNMCPESFDVLKEVWVRALGIPICDGTSLLSRGPRRGVC